MRRKRMSLGSSSPDSAAARSKDRKHQTRATRSLRRRNGCRHLQADYRLNRDFLAHAADGVANAVPAAAAGCNSKRLLAWLALLRAFLLVAPERADAS